ncbi:MAG: hypothetical protein QOJ26_887, partial [Thermoplasmata archaeon]|nr:hypothetical protein [Thermoplasmata archaeon]
ATVGIGFTVVALGTAVGVVSKGGFDTALLQKIPLSSGAEGRRLLAFSVLLGAGIALALTAGLALADRLGGLFTHVPPIGWALVAAIAILLVLTWLQDAYFLAIGRARLTFERNVVLSLTKLLLPLPVIALALVQPVALTWALALGASALAGLARSRRFAARGRHRVRRREFLGSAARNMGGGAAEFLPGLLLVPFVLAMQGPEAAAYFGIAWTSAALIFQASGAIGRSALAHLIQSGPQGRPAAIRRGVMEHLVVVAPLALLLGVFASPFLALFGSAYSVQGARVLAILCVSAVLVAPISLYVAVLRSHDRTIAPIAFPVAILAGLAVWAPLLGDRYGIAGIAVAWFLANAPLAAYATWRLRQTTVEVMPFANPAAEIADAAPVHRGADLE